MAEQTVKDLKKEIYLVTHKTQEMLALTEEGFLKSKLSSLDEADELAGEIHDKEDALTSALARMAGGNGEARAILGVPAHLEKVATSVTRIADTSRTRIKDGILFSDKAIAETGTLFAKAKEVLKKSAQASVTGDAGAVGDAIADSDTVVRLANEYATSHEERLVTGECSPKASSTYLCILYAFQDLGGHLKEALKKLSGK